ncbi:cyclin-Y-like protein 1 [Myotis yumanensis]|uniref:cyclin-Y-like protein 1 n=1 Tax=Myotis yumanensis TaxID=159337 RepID=UPI0038CF9D26
MGNKLTCCWKPKASRRRGRESESVHPAPESGDHDREAGRADGDFEFLDFMFTKGVPVLRLRDLQLPEGLIPSDHPEACTIFLKKSQVDVLCSVEFKKHTDRVFQLIVTAEVSTDNLREKYSSCATLYVDSTISQSDLRLTVQCLALAIYHHIKNRDANRSKDIFDERIHPFTENTVQEEHFTTAQEEHFTHNPDPESIYQFIHPFFVSISVTAGYAIATLIYIERLLTYAEIDICPTNWKRIVFGAIVLAFKYWHDLDISNSIFCRICRGITAKDLSELEREYFYLLQFSLNVSLSVYAKYYFDLRSLASDHGLPIAFAPLGKERALNLEGEHKAHFPGIGVAALLDLPLRVKLPMILGSNNLYHMMTLSEKVIFAFMLVVFAHVYLLLKFWAGGIIRPFFFENEAAQAITVNGARYRDMIIQFFVPKLQDMDVDDM